MTRRETPLRAADILVALADHDVDLVIIGGRARALEIEVAGVRVAVAGKDDLIAMKRATGRPLDRGDVVAITADESQP